ncbi:hypothetical protein RFI_22228 [Reticulomyxa filosa]|uniref:Uncharacterized protein n=1 Tax=Reticulomyxa filosa TaxID=46433 RepID=X6MMP3_RETFI|nr:hypothetical protein RFI_22228 [Reticulomyxa filosa]|eukprot:ETO15134.1 hypothetical protein RFI_22228 [Reticulomyxa filosa]
MIVVEKEYIAKTADCCHFTQQILNGKNERDNRYLEKFWNDLVFSKEKGKYCFKDGSTILLISFFLFMVKRKKKLNTFSLILIVFAIQVLFFFFLAIIFIIFLFLSVILKIKTTTIRTQRQKICGKCQTFVIKNAINLSLFALRFTVLTGTATTTATFSIKKVLYSFEIYVLYVSIDHTYFNQIIKKKQHYNLEYRLRM